MTIRGDFAIPPRLFLTEGQRIAFYPCQALSDRSENWIATITSSDTAKGVHPVTGRDCLILDPAALGCQAAFDARPANGPLTRMHAEFEIAIAPAWSTARPKIHCIGDSLTNRLLHVVDARLRSRGMVPEFVGTVEQVGGIMGEGREGKMAAQFAGRCPGMARIPAGDEAVYLALDPADKGQWTPYLRPDENGPEVVDIAWYLARFGLAIPDHVVIALGTNDVSADRSTASAETAAMLDIFVPQLLALSPTLRIGLLQHTIARDVGDDESRWAIHHAIVRDCIARARASKRVDVLAAYLHQSADGGWHYPLVIADPATGLARRTDPIGGDSNIHFGVANAEVAAAIVAAWIGGHY